MKWTLSQGQIFYWVKIYFSLFFIVLFTLPSWQFLYLNKSLQAVPILEIDVVSQTCKTQNILLTLRLTSEQFQIFLIVRAKKTAPAVLYNSEYVLVVSLHTTLQESYKHQKLNPKVKNQAPITFLQYILFSLFSYSQFLSNIQFTFMKHSFICTQYSINTSTSFSKQIHSMNF